MEDKAGELKKATITLSMKPHTMPVRWLVENCLSHMQRIMRVPRK